jgi:hypothetical protein
MRMSIMPCLLLLAGSFVLTSCQTTPCHKYEQRPMLERKRVGSYEIEYQRMTWVCVP